MNSSFVTKLLIISLFYGGMVDRSNVCELTLTRAHDQLLGLGVGRQLGCVDHHRSCYRSSAALKHGFVHVSIPAL